MQPHEKDNNDLKVPLLSLGLESSFLYLNLHSNSKS